MVVTLNNWHGPQFRGLRRVRQRDVSGGGRGSAGGRPHWARLDGSQGRRTGGGLRGSGNHWGGDGGGRWPEGGTGPNAWRADAAAGDIQPRCEVRNAVSGESVNVAAIRQIPPAHKEFSNPAANLCWWSPLPKTKVPKLWFEGQCWTGCPWDTWGGGIEPRRAVTQPKSGTKLRWSLNSGGAAGARGSDGHQSADGVQVGWRLHRHGGWVAAGGVMGTFGELRGVGWPRQKAMKNAGVGGKEIAKRGARKISISKKKLSKNL